jgi:hypothetical protein
MKTSNKVCRLVLVMLAGGAVVLAGVGCGEEKAGPATSPVTPGPAPAPTPATKVAVVPTPAPPVVTPAPTPTPTPAPVVKPPAPAGDFEAFAKKQEVPCVRVPVLGQAPTVDGVLDDVYKKATPLKFKFLAGGEGKPTAATTAYAVSADKELFLFLTCESPDMDALRADVREHDGQVWQDDSVEIFLDPTNKREVDGYMHLIVNALGTTAEAKGPKGDEDFSWTPKLRVKTKVDKKSWTVELAIPFAEMVKDPARMNRVWAANFNRMAFLFEGNEDTAWSPTGGTDSHVPAKFGCLWLDAGAVDNSKQ